MKKMKKTIVTFMLAAGIVLMPASEISTTTVVYAKPQMVYVTPTGKKYHAHKCGRGTYTKAKLSDAKKRGLTPCKNCYS